MRRFITTLDDLAMAPPRRLLLLYSGGVDGTYLLRWLQLHRIEAVALTVNVDGAVGAGANAAEESATAAEHAARFGAEYREYDAAWEFFADFVPMAIHADAYYQGQFPVGSTLTRPLMARTAVRLARELGCDAVGHTATYMQNSALRLSASVCALDGELDVVAPYLGSDVLRAEKLTALREAGLPFADGVHSVDANPWSRVIECGSLESPENELDETVFVRTRDVRDCPAEPALLDLSFEAGLPVALDGARTDLAELVGILNALGGIHGVGRFSGLEDTPFGVKNHEVRESPAAAVITAAHRALGNAVYNTREHAIRAGLARDWTDIVVHGGWYSHLGRSLAGILAALDQPLTGTVGLRLQSGSITVLRLSSPNGLYYSRLGKQFHDWMRSYSYDPWLTLATLTDQVRNNGGPA